MATIQNSTKTQTHLYDMESKIKIKTMTNKHTSLSLSCLVSLNFSALETLTKVRKSYYRYEKGPWKIMQQEWRRIGRKKIRQLETSNWIV